VRGERELRIAVVGGDGIGPEVIDAAIPAIDAAAATGGGGKISWERLPYGADHYLKTGETLPDAALQHLRQEVDAIFLGAVGDPRVPGNEHARDILLGLRFKLDLFINFRPCVLLHPDLSVLKSTARRGGSEEASAIDFVIFRENTEGPYLSRGSWKNVGTPQEEQVSEDVNTAAKVERIIRAAFTWARAKGKTLVTMADKSNAIPAHRLWSRMLRRVGEDFPEIQRELHYVDALAMELVQRPERFQVIVTTNGVSAAPITVALSPLAPGLLSANEQGSGQGAILVAGTNQVASPARPVNRTEAISIYCLGLGAVANPPASGTPAPFNAPVSTTNAPTVQVGGVPGTVLFSGLAPGFTGLYQVNVQMPLNAPTGASIPVVLSFGSVISNTVTIAVQ